MTRSLTLTLLSMVLWCAAAGGTAEQAKRDTPEQTNKDTSQQAKKEKTEAPRARGVQIEMKNVQLHADEGIILDVRRLLGTMISQSAGSPPIFDDQRSYVIDVAAAEIAIDIGSLQNLMNQSVLGEHGPLTDVKLAVRSGRIELKGKLHKGLTVPISAKANVGVTGEGRMKLHVESMKTMGVPAKGLLDLFGLKVEDLMTLTKRGVTVSDDDIILDPGQIVPPPAIRGRLTQVAVTGNGLVQTFADAEGRRVTPMRKPAPAARNYIYFGGGDIRFGKLTMNDADLQLIDADPRDPFDFFPARYNVQLVAGYSKNTPAKGLKTYMPDYGDIRKDRGDRNK
jgi:hypothetical protein